MDYCGCNNCFSDDNHLPFSDTKSLYYVINKSQSMGRLCIVCLKINDDCSKFCIRCGNKLTENDGDRLVNICELLKKSDTFNRNIYALMVGSIAISLIALIGTVISPLDPYSRAILVAAACVIFILTTGVILK